MNQLEKIASDIFHYYGVDFATARRAGGWTNATWIAGGYALRLSSAPNNDKIRREVQLAALLPAVVGYPENITTGVIEGHEWSLSKEIPGKNLSEVWPELDWSQRTSAIRQIWEKVESIHSLRLEKVGQLARKRAWYNSCDREEADASTNRLVERGLFTSSQGTRLKETLERFWKALPTAAPVLNHGDITMDNMIWHQGQVVSLMDFEFAVIAPAQLDLNSLMKFVFGPGAQDNSLHVDSKEMQQFQQVALDLAKPILSHPGGVDLLLGYAVLLEQFILELWLAHPDGEGPIENWEPYRRLLSLASGQGGYLAPFLELSL